MKFVTLIFFVFVQNCYSQNLDKVIDSSFSYLGMTKNDLWMPCDAVDPDPFRFSLICSFFEQPLSTINYTNSYLSQSKFSPFTKDSYSNLCTTLEIPNVSTKVNGYNFSRILKSLLLKSLKNYPEILTLQTLLEEIVSICSIEQSNNTFLFAEVDKLLRNSESDEKSDVYSFKLKEIASHYQSLKLFDSINIYRSIVSTKLNQGFLSSQKIAELQKLLEKHPLELDSKIVIKIDKSRSIVLGSKGDDIYLQPEFLIIDTKGNDTYRFNETKESLVLQPNRIILDLEGNDLYVGNDFSFGSGYFGIGILFDVKGNDHYIAGSLSLGAGIFGFGFLYDQQGNDTYTSAVTTQGAGAFGMGLLWDKGGNDIYTAQSQGQGFGYTLGFGILREEGGNDHYITNSPFLDVLRYDNHFVTFTQGASLGFRPIASGGIGILSDTEGNDHYTSDIYGQGTAYWFGLGALVDSKGEDVYTSFQYSQGSGVHLAFGILLDSSGNDIYTSHGVSQGCGHDIAMGALIDFNGDDHYFVESLSLGSGNANASSLFYDLKGNDSYVGLNSTNTFGYSDFRRNYGMMGVFCDVSGTDNYNSILKNTSVSHKSTYGVFLDLEFDKINTVSENSAATSVNQTIELSKNLDSLFIQASTALNKYQYLVTPARKQFSNLPQELVIPFLVTKFSSVFPRDRLALEIILPEVFEKSPNWESVVLDSLESSSNIRVLSICSYLVTRKKLKKALPIYVKLLTSNNWKIASLFAERIGEIADSSNINTLFGEFGNKHPYVRSKIALSIGILSKGERYPFSNMILNDSEQVVRNNYVAGLLNSDTISLSFVSYLLENTKTLEAEVSVLRLLDKIEHSEKSTSFLFSKYLQLSIQNRSILLSELVKPRNKLYFTTLLLLLKSKETNEILYRYFQ